MNLYLWGKWIWQKTANRFAISHAIVYLFIYWGSFHFIQLRSDLVFVKHKKVNCYSFRSQSFINYKSRTSYQDTTGVQKWWSFNLCIHCFHGTRYTVDGAWEDFAGIRIHWIEYQVETKIKVIGSTSSKQEAMFVWSPRKNRIQQFLRLGFIFPVAL